MKKKRKLLYEMAFCAALLSPFAQGNLVSAARERISYSQTASAEEQAAANQVGKYGMLPIYGFDVKDGVYSVEVESSSSMFRITEATLTVKDQEMTADLTLSGTGYLKLFMGTGQEAAAAQPADYIGYTENADGSYTYTVPVEALDKKINCAAFSKRKEQWYDRVILFDASSLPSDALLVELPDYDAIEAAMELAAGSSADGSSVDGSSVDESPADEDSADGSSADGDSADESPADEDSADGSSAPAQPVSLDMEDGEYSIEVSMSGGSGKSAIVSPTLLTVTDGKAYAKIQWSSSNYDYMLVGTEKFLNTAEEGADSVFEIPITTMDSEMPVIADTLAMGEPHEIDYTLTFYSDTIGSKSQLPQEAAKRVVGIALVIIVGGGILNHFVNKKRQR